LNFTEDYIANLPKFHRRFYDKSSKIPQKIMQKMHQNSPENEILQNKFSVINSYIIPLNIFSSNIHISNNKIKFSHQKFSLKSSQNLPQGSELFCRYNSSIIPIKSETSKKSELARARKKSSETFS
jgi:hypothetical protein